MGIPVICLSGDSHAGRVGVDLLTRIGLVELVAENVKHYREIVLNLARDPRQIASLRASMRRRMSTSPLCNGAAFARSVEDAYRTMWRGWCATRQQPGGTARADRS